jgi:hypothetical protein
MQTSETRAPDPFKEESRWYVRTSDDEQERFWS